MSSVVDFYTFAPMAAAVINGSPTNTNSAYPGATVLDRNRDLTWRASTETSSRQLVIDLGAAQPAQGWGLIIHVRNYGVHNANANIVVEHSPDNSSWTTAGGPPNINTATPLLVFDLGALLSGKRYWRITIPGGSSIAPQVSLIALTKKTSLTISHQLPQKDKDSFYGDQASGPGGYLRAYVQIGNPAGMFTRQYKIGATDLATLRQAFKESLGGKEPLGLVEGNNAIRLVKFAQQDLEWNTTSPGFYTVDVRYSEIPFIDSGQVF